MSSLLDQVTGLRSLCLQLSLIMADDFGLSSLNIVHDPDRETASANMSDQEQQFDHIYLDRFHIREDRKWENMLRPYIVINADGETISFIGAYLNRFLFIYFLFSIIIINIIEIDSNQF